MNTKIYDSVSGERIDLTVKEVLKLAGEFQKMRCERPGIELGLKDWYDLIGISNQKVYDGKLWSDCPYIGLLVNYDQQESCVIYRIIYNLYGM